MSVARTEQRQEVECASEPNWKCTYPSCQKFFDCEKTMKRHKLSDPEHNYCKKCDVDCESWEELVQHKVNLMQKFWSDKTKQAGDQPKHITCEFCGEDFKSFGGRKTHRTRMHAADQSIFCPAKDEGCHCLFTRAAHMIQHLEQGHCPIISAYDFETSIVHKRVMEEILKDPAVFTEKLYSSMAYAGAYNEPILVTNGGGVRDAGDDEAGGVSLLDEEVAGQKGGCTPLAAEVNLIDLNATTPRPHREAWPRLSSESSYASSTPPDSHKASLHANTEAPSGRDVFKGYTQVWPPLKSTKSAPPVDSDNGSDDDSDVDSDDAETPAPTTTSKKPLPAWTTGQTSKELFKHAKPTHLSKDLAHRMEKHGLAKKKSINLMYSHFYDPRSADYNPDFFRCSLTHKYECPFPDCSGFVYDTYVEMEYHLMQTHLRTRIVCTTCLKRFNSATALTAHIESAGRCRIKDSNNYEKVWSLMLWRGKVMLTRLHSFLTR